MVTEKYYEPFKIIFNIKLQIFTSDRFEGLLWKILWWQDHIFDVFDGYDSGLNQWVWISSYLCCQEICWEI